MFFKKVCFILLFPLMMSGGTNGSHPELKSVTKKFAQMVQPRYDADNNRVLFAAQIVKQFCAYYLHSEETNCTFLDRRPGPIIPMKDSWDEYVVGLDDFYGTLKWDGSSHYSIFTSVRSVQGDADINQVVNVAETDSWGRLIIASQGQIGNVAQTDNEGLLYSYQKEKCNLRLELEGNSVAYGLALSPDGTKLYFVGCDEHQVGVYDYDKSTGQIKNRRTFIDFKARNIPGQPRGLCTDSDGNVWIACFKGSRVIQAASYDAEILKTLDLPVSQPTDCAWGGEHHDTLFITTASDNFTPEDERREPMAGTLLSVTGLKARGKPNYDAVLCKNGHYGHGGHEHGEHEHGGHEHGGHGQYGHEYGGHGYGGWDSEEEEYPYHQPQSCCGTSDYD